ncbi:hypothetical protein YB2330_005737 [Saitoella coloradoensis]
MVLTLGPRREQSISAIVNVLAYIPSVTTLNPHAETTYAKQQSWLKAKDKAELWLERTTTKFNEYLDEINKVYPTSN